MSIATPAIDHTELVPHLLERLHLPRDVAEAMARRAREALSGAAGLVWSGDSPGQVRVVEASSYDLGWSVEGDATALGSAVGVVCKHGALALRSGDVDFRRIAGCAFGGAHAHLFRRRRGSIFLVTTRPHLPGRAIQRLRFGALGGGVRAIV